MKFGGLKQSFFPSWGRGRGGGGGGGGGGRDVQAKLKQRGGGVGKRKLWIITEGHH